MLSHYDQGMGVSGLQDIYLEIVSNHVIHIEITHTWSTPRRMYLWWIDEGQNGSANL